MLNGGESGKGEECGIFEIQRLSHLFIKNPSNTIDNNLSTIYGMHKSFATKSVGKPVLYVVFSGKV